MRAGLLAVAAIVACSEAAPAGRGEAWPVANALFHREARFVGGDGAYSIDLGDDRVLWLFGDTFVARDHERVHEGSAFLRNSVALQTGRDPTNAYIRHYWRHDGDAVTSFFAEPSEGVWLWPAHGVRLEGTLVVFFERLHNEGNPGPWSFVDDGWDARLVDDPDAEPSEWTPQPVLLPPDGGAGVTLGEAVVVSGEHAYAFGTRGDSHEVVLARFDPADVGEGDLSRPELRCDDGWAVGCTPRALFSPGAPEFSVHFEAALDRWVWVASGGFGAAPIVWRTARALDGPWSDPTDVFRPPEAFLDDAFVYAGKAHPELDAGGSLAVTYVPSGLDGFPTTLDGVYYFPFFARVWPR